MISIMKCNIILDRLFRFFLDELIKAVESRAACALLEKCGHLVHQMRDTHALLMLGKRLANLWLKGSQDAGEYFTTLGLLRSGRAANAEVERSLRRSVDLNPAVKAEAILSLAAETCRAGTATICHDGLLEALAVKDQQAAIRAMRMLISQQAESGDHSEAVNLFRDLCESVRVGMVSSPILQYDLLNSLAVELLAASAISPHLSSSTFVMSYPFARRYPEWRETSEQIQNLRDEKATHTSIALTGQSEKGKVLEFQPRLPKEAPRASAEESSNDVIVRFSETEKTTLRFINRHGQERLTLKIYHDDDGAVADLLIRDEAGKNHTMLSTCFLD